MEYKQEIDKILWYATEYTDLSEKELLLAHETNRSNISEAIVTSLEIGFSLETTIEILIDVMQDTKKID